MDDRQSQINTGAGLEDSRINKEFVDFLNKWSLPVVCVLAVAFGINALLQYQKRQRVVKTDNAFLALDAATVGGSVSPSSLTSIASEYQGVKSVAELANLKAVEIYINSFLTGLQPGAGAGGIEIADTDRLDEDQRKSYLNQARTLAQGVVDSTSSDPGKALLTIQAHIRLGVISECNRDFDGARASYNQAKTVAETAEFPGLVAFAQMRVDGVDLIKDEITLPSQADLAPLPGEVMPGFTLPADLDTETPDSTDPVETGETSEASTDDVSDSEDPQP